MPQTKHKYRVSIYLGKENYEAIKEMSDFFGISVAQITRIMIDTGMQFAKAVEKGEKPDGSK